MLGRRRRGGYARAGELVWSRGSWQPVVLDNQRGVLGFNDLPSLRCKRRIRLMSAGFVCKLPWRPYGRLGFI
jgi:hypothetical protein